MNSWIGKEKAHVVIPLMGRIGQMIMEKQDIRRTLSSKMIEKILPHITKELITRSRNLKYVIHMGHITSRHYKGTENLEA